MAKIQFIIERSHLNVKFVLMLDRRHKVEPYPVAVRMTYDYQQKYILTGVRMTEAEYVKSLKAVKGELYDRRKRAEDVFDKVFDTGKELLAKGTFSAQRIAERLNGGGSELVDDVYRRKIEELRSSGKEKTARLYENSADRFKDVFGKVRFKELTPTMVSRFDARMKKDGLSGATRGIYLRNLRSVCNIAISMELMNASSYPFSRTSYDRMKVTIPRGGSRTEYCLDREEMRRLYERVDAGNRYLGMFLVSYLCNGANLADIAFLRYGERFFSVGELDFVRRKSRDTTREEIVVRIPVTEELRRLMEMFAAKPKMNCYVFPDILGGAKEQDRIISLLDGYNRRIGKSVRRECRELGIEKSPTMTWARHSFKTNLIRQNVPERYCEQAMGHVDNSVAGHYVGSFSHEDMMRYNGMLL